MPLRLIWHKLICWGICTQKAWCGDKGDTLYNTFFFWPSKIMDIDHLSRKNFCSLVRPFVNGWQYNSTCLASCTISTFSRHFWRHDPLMVTSMQGSFYAANWLILANFDPNFVTPKISVNQVKKRFSLYAGGFWQTFHDCLSCSARMIPGMTSEVDHDVSDVVWWVDDVMTQFWCHAGHQKWVMTSGVWLHGYQLLPCYHQYCHAHGGQGRQKSWDKFYEWKNLPNIMRLVCFCKLCKNY